MFKQAFWINLDHRTDRRDQMEAELGSIKVSAERFSARREKAPAGYRGRLLNMGFYSCNMSHLDLLRKVKERKMQWAWIMEDDAKFDSKFNSVFPLVLKWIENHEWDMLYFYQSKSSKPHSTNDIHIIKNEFKLTRITYLIQSHCYFVHSRAMDILIRKLESEKSQPCDVVFKRLQSRLKCYALSPSVCVQRQSLSDITGEISSDLGYL